MMNTSKFLLLIIAISILSSSCNKTIKGCMDPLSTNFNGDATEDDGSCTYAAKKIGESVGGGIVFYVDATGQHGLVAATSDQANAITWLNSTVSATGATFSQVGKGAFNTGAIVNVYGAGSYAAQKCDDLSSGGYSDWFLPSKDELNLMYTNLFLKSIGNFAFARYWSSTEVDDNNAICVEFSSGSVSTQNKISSYSVRAARAF